MVSECRISFGDIHFLGKLICFMHFYRHYNSNLRFSFILSMKFFVSPRILTVFWAFTNHSPGHVTMTSQLKWRSTDWLFENSHFLSDYSISRFLYSFLFHNSLIFILSEHNDLCNNTHVLRIIVYLRYYMYLPFTVHFLYRPFQLTFLGYGSWFQCFWVQF